MASLVLDDAFLQLPPPNLFLLCLFCVGLLVEVLAQWRPERGGVRPARVCLHAETGPANPLARACLSVWVQSFPQSLRGSPAGAGPAQFSDSHHACVSVCALHLYAGLPCLLISGHMCDDEEVHCVGGC